MAEATQAQLAVVPPAAVPEKPKVRLIDLLRLMTDFDNAVAQDFNPEEIVGDLRDKVDDIKHVLDRLEGQERWCRDRAAPFQKAAQAIARNRERLKNYVVWAMQQEHFQAVPGNEWKARLQDNPASLEMLQPEPTALDYRDYPDYVEPIRRYEWKTSAIKEALAAGKLTFGEEKKPFAKLNIGQHVRFDINPPAKIEGKKGARK